MIFSIFRFFLHPQIPYLQISSDHNKPYIQFNSIHLSSAFRDANYCISALQKINFFYIIFSNSLSVVTQVDVHVAEIKQLVNATKQTVNTINSNYNMLRSNLQQTSMESVFINLSNDA